ncbi:excinuclease ABC subunit UvrA [Methanothermobacter thermautotrophicus]|uniref:excinuclease ABC subunit UvrA n=1 Tax=Methanothermobacter thermautotrophicus TaxID=145262 RepID=UPI001994DCE5|nr:excinuclease ABC subunit UvrA [Methanothermobacter thermautotrophicus]MBC7111095.1 excinuclease ABC subunit UvrA [Methanothermobacter sp.]MDI6817770.1 excinuclease ABC subunit UvrA [Methanothermobacter thermautotrophicus]WBF06724.1 excinuclease ABC subunit UvrA [Methanothermobacter thermautotrophicus]
MSGKIVIKGAREHNLQNVDLELPRDKFIVITGISGSGKSSLAFDTIYAEGQRRYVESLSAYARQFLGQMKKPEMDYIEGLSPAISIDQKTTRVNPRSTVGTITEIYDYLRLLFARIGKPHCYLCGREIEQQTSTQIVDRIMDDGEGERIIILAPVVRDRKGEHQRVFERLREQGFVRVRVDGEIHDLEDEFDLDRNRKHSIDVVVDRLVVRRDTEFRKRLADSVETALQLGEGTVRVLNHDTGEERIYSEHFACPDCGINFEEISPRMFSFNSPHGACPECNGLGSKLEIDPDLVVPYPERSINEGAIVPWSKSGKRDNYYHQMLRAVAEHYGFSLDTPFRDLDEEHRRAILYGTDEKIQFVFQRKNRTYRVNRRFEGVIPRMERIYMETKSNYMRTYIGRFMSNHACPVCGGSRLRPESLSVTINGRSIHDVVEMSIREAHEFFDSLKLTEREEYIAREVLKEIRERLRFLIDVGLDYLTLSRSSGTLSGGEAQRIRLATQIGSGLVGVLYILDEPSIGLHQRDNRRLIETLKRLRDLGNTLIVVEHDEETILSADHVVDIGPGAGEHGGCVVAEGTPEEIMEDPDSLTGAYLSGRETIPLPEVRRRPSGRYLTVRGAAENNLREIDVRIPLGLFTCVTGVSGSGKSTLVNDILYRGVYERLNHKHMNAGRHTDIEGLQHIDKVVMIDQSPIGRTPRSNPATYTGVFTHIRELFAQTPEARKRGYRPGRFSFNVKGGRCEACGGDGIIKIEMHFLADVYVPCEVCRGRRYNEETLEIRYRGRNIAEVLDMTVEEALEFFENIPQVRRKLQTLYDVGLGYIKLGQPATTLSGGEAQRVKLAKELSRRSTGSTLYILDEPTTGLHFDDIKKLLNVLGRLVDAGNTAVVIEHNLDVIKSADHIIDLGPEGGERGGLVVAEGTPEEVAASGTHTGRFLREVLADERSQKVPVGQDTG